MFSEFIDKHFKEAFEKSNNRKDKLIRMVTHYKAAEK